MKNENKYRTSLNIGFLPCFSEILLKFVTLFRYYEDTILQNELNVN